jgi:hypothetical protein
MLCKGKSGMTTHIRFAGGAKVRCANYRPTCASMMDGRPLMVVDVFGLPPAPHSNGMGCTSPSISAGTWPPAAHAQHIPLQCATTCTSASQVLGITWLQANTCIRSEVQHMHTCVPAHCRRTSPGSALVKKQPWRPRCWNWLQLEMAEAHICVRETGG